MKLKILILLCILFTLISKSQQLPLFSQYSENMFLINPAYAGAEGPFSVTVVSELQWIGIPEAPNTQTLSCQGRVPGNTISTDQKGRHKNVKKIGHVGLGGYIYNDQNALIGKTGFQFTYAYYLFLRGNTQLSFGLGLTGYQFRLDRNAINSAVNLDDAVIEVSNVKSSFVLDGDFGVFLTNQKYFTGLSVLQFTQSAVKAGNNSLNNYELYRNYNLIMGYNYNINHDYTLVPSMLLRTTADVNYMLVDLTCKLVFMESVWGGMAYRTNNDFIVMIGFKYNNLYCTYAFDWPNNPIAQHSFGSHELTITYKFNEKHKYNR